jgi:hypothetical protein
MLGLIPDLIKNQALAKDAYQLLGGLKIENLTHVDAIPEPDPNVRGEIEFNNVSFSYPTDEGNLALKQASFRVGPGEHIALGKFPYLEYASSNFSFMEIQYRCRPNTDTIRSWFVRCRQVDNFGYLIAVVRGSHGWHGDI